jgi:hypothetical protein
MASLNNRNNKVTPSVTAPRSFVQTKSRRKFDFKDRILESEWSDSNTASIGLHMMESATRAKGRDPFNAESVTEYWTLVPSGFLELSSPLFPSSWE